jgi:hypothetical protein
MGPGCRVSGLPLGLSDSGGRRRFPDHCKGLLSASCPKPPPLSSSKNLTDVGEEIMLRKKAYHIRPPVRMEVASGNNGGGKTSLCSLLKEHMSSDLTPFINSKALYKFSRPRSHSSTSHFLIIAGIPMVRPCEAEDKGAE